MDPLAMDEDDRAEGLAEAVQRESAAQADYEKWIRQLRGGKQGSAAAAEVALLGEQVRLACTLHASPGFVQKGMFGELCVSFVTPLETNIIDLWVSPFESWGLEKPCMLLPLSSGGSGRSWGATAGVVKILK